MSHQFNNDFVMRHNARIAAGKGQKIEGFAGVTVDLKRRSAESKLHADILAECKRRGWIALHGSMAHATFRTKGEWDFTIIADCESEVCPRCESMRCRNGSSISCNCGVPWLTIQRTYLIEAKAAKGKLSQDQQAIHAWAAKLGRTVHVVRSFAEFLEVIR